MANTNFAHKPLWLNEDGSVANVVYAPIDQTAAFTIDAFSAEFERAKAVKDSGKAELSQLIFGDGRVESASDQEFGTLKKNFTRQVSEEQFNTFVARQSANLATVVASESPEQIERHVLNKSRGAKTAAFKINAPANAPQDVQDRINTYNGAVDAVNAYHAEIERIEAIGEDAYLTGDQANGVTGKLENLTPMQLATIRAATGSRPGDNSKIVKSYKTFHAAEASEKVKEAGFISYVATNAMTAKQLEENERAALDNLEEAVDAEIVNLGPGATRDERKAIYQQAEARKTNIATAFQNAGTDAKYVLSDLSSKAYDATH